jgi:hypothetical protein
MRRDDEGLQGDVDGPFGIRWPSGVDRVQYCEAHPVGRGSRLANLPVAIIVSVIIQVGGLIWLSASVLTRVEERLSQHAERLVRAEAALEKTGNTLIGVLERLARAEEGISLQMEARRSEGRSLHPR